MFLLLITGFICFSGKAQSPSTDAVYNRYLDFNYQRSFGDKGKVMELGEKLLPDADKLPEKARISFYFSVGKMYEDNNQPDKATPYFEMVAAAVPDYYVVHRALGYIYLENLKQIGIKLNASSGNKALNANLTLAYNEAARKALLHLEKAQACDPSDETLAIIKILYKNIKDVRALDSLNSRLSQLSKNCIDILLDH